MEGIFSNMTSSDCSYNFATGISLTAASLVASLLGSFGNILVLITFCTLPSLQTVSNLFIVNLSLADLVVTMVALPLNCVWTIRKTQGNCLSQEILYSRRAFVSFSSCASLLILGWVSVERSIVMSWPLTYKLYITRGRILVVLTGSWLFSMIYGVIAVFDAYAAFTALFSTSATVVCYFVITVCYVKIFIVVLRQKQIQPALQVSPQQTQALEKQVAKTMGLVIGLFTLCFAPFTVARQTRDSHGALHDALLVLALSHSATNPLIYFYRSRDYRTAFKRILCCHCYQQGNHQEIQLRRAWTTNREN